jgi:hypothetical protein
LENKPKKIRDSIMGYKLKEEKINIQKSSEEAQKAEQESQSTKKVT